MPGKDCAPRRVILACDYDDISSGTLTPAAVAARAVRDIRAVSPFICAVKINFHLLFPLGVQHVLRITQAARACGLQSIADIKLNDIPNTNRVATDILWRAGFDAVIANPIMGLGSLCALVDSAHAKDKGVITLCHMSAPEARASYEMQAYPTKRSKNTRHLYKIFLDWALRSGVDGIIVGATFPGIIRECAARITSATRQKAGTRPLIISPGVGAQGANATDSVSAGSDYVIAGRSIIASDDPTGAAHTLYDSMARI